MLIKTAQILTELGLNVQASGNVILVQVDETAKHTLVIIERLRAPYKSEIEKLSDLQATVAKQGIPLLAAPYISERTGRHLEQAGWSWIDLTGNVFIRAKGLQIHNRIVTHPPARAQLKLPKGNGSWAVIRECIVNGRIEGVSQVAQKSLLSQPRVSQILAALVSLGFLEKQSRSVWQVDRRPLLEAFLDQYSGPGGTTKWFYTLDPLREVISNTVKHLDKKTINDVRVSGDIAADAIAPWKTPTVAVLYCRNQSRLLNIDLLEVEAGESNIILHFPADTSMFANATTSDFGSIAYADPTQILWDLHTLGGDDRIEAIEQFIERLWP